MHRRQLSEDYSGSSESSTPRRRRRSHSRSSKSGGLSSSGSLPQRYLSLSEQSKTSIKSDAIARSRAAISESLSSGISSSGRRKLGRKRSRKGLYERELDWLNMSVLYYMDQLEMVERYRQSLAAQLDNFSVPNEHREWFDSVSSVIKKSLVEEEQKFYSPKVSAYMAFRDNIEKKMEEMSFSVLAPDQRLNRNSFSSMDMYVFGCLFILGMLINRRRLMLMLSV